MRLSWFCLRTLVFSNYYIAWDHNNVSCPFKGHTFYGEQIMLHVNRIVQGQCEVEIEFWCLANQRWIAKRPNEFGAIYPYRAVATPLFFQSSR